MKTIARDKRFEKHFKKRIALNSKLLDQFEQRLTLFINGQRGYPLDDHPLTGKLAGRRAFSITPDIRVIYEAAADVIIFLDIGTHNQIYR